MSFIPCKGVYIKFQIHIFAPPPFLIFSAFFFTILSIFSQLAKKYAYF